MMNPAISGKAMAGLSVEDVDGVTETGTRSCMMICLVEALCTDLAVQVLLPVFRVDDRENTGPFLILVVALICFRIWLHAIGQLLGDDSASLDRLGLCDDLLSFLDDLAKLRSRWQRNSRSKMCPSCQSLLAMISSADMRKFSPMHFAITLRPGLSRGLSYV